MKPHRSTSWASIRLLALALASSSLPRATAQGFVPNLGPPHERITVQCGDITLLLRQQSQWTPGRIDFKGTPMTTERSAYGTVISFPEVGFIGTAHLENEPENLKSLTFALDGQTLEKPDASLTGNTFRFKRKSRIRNFHLDCEIKLKDNRLYETTTVATDEAAPLKLVYHFMHAWTPTVSAYLAGSAGATDKEDSGALPNAKGGGRKFVISRRVDWVAVYEPKSGQFAVSRLLEAPHQGGHASKIWNVPGAYQKYYLTSFQNQTVPAGFKGKWRMVTAFGKSDFENWESAARELANDLREQKTP
jgi:hypothetical protein